MGVIVYLILGNDITNDYLIILLPSFFTFDKKK